MSGEVSAAKGSETGAPSGPYALSARRRPPSTCIDPHFPSTHLGVAETKPIMSWVVGRRRFKCEWLVWVANELRLVLR